jgi:squalene synthase HpnC
MMLLADAAPIAPSAREVMARAGGENFPVASRALPRRVRADLLAVYGFARLVDELGDAAPGDRLAALEWLDGELTLAFEGTPRHPLLVRLAVTVRERALAREPFARLIEANRLDQRVKRYETWAQLRDYCALSANPVGEIVLAVMGRSTPERVALSDSICTALQLAEHCQDVAEDFAAGRVYLPAEDMRRFGATTGELQPAATRDRDSARAPLRAVVAFEVRRARDLLDEGAALVGELHGRERLAIAAFVAGGRAALDAIEGTGYDVLAGPVKASRRRRLRALLEVLAAQPRRGARGAATGAAQSRS